MQTESWYNSNIANNAIYASHVANGKFCNDRNVDLPLTGESGFTTTWSATETEFRYAAGKRLWELTILTLGCNVEANAVDIYNFLLFENLIYKINDFVISL